MEEKYLELKESAYQWHLLFEDGSATSEDRKAFERWLNEDPRHRDAYDRATIAWDAFDELHGVDLGLDRTRTSYPPKTDRPERPHRRIRDRNFGGLHASRLMHFGVFSAAVIVCAFFFVTHSSGPHLPPPISAPPIVSTFETERGQISMISLPEGSNVTLAPLTTIEMSMSAERRDISIKGGSAVFDVSDDPSRPFSVTADEVVATVLGTVFEVRRNGGVVRIAVEEGEVEVARPMRIANQRTGSIIRHALHDGENGVVALKAGTAKFGTFRKEDFAPWRQSRLNYDGATLIEVVEDANRYSERQILIEGDVGALEGLTMTGFFNSKDIDQLLSNLPAVFPVEVSDRPEQTSIVVKIR
ncbi:MAG: FecR domain-containing protein [Pseudomonadota bacterium]